MSLPNSNEGFTPIPVVAPSTFGRKLLWRLRLLTDLQLASIVYDLVSALRTFSTEKTIDVGCGDMPFRHLVQMKEVDKEIDYVGYDVVGTSDSFGFNNSKAVQFDGLHLPLPDNSVDTAICTEVLEHHPSPEQLVDEIFRVLKKGGALFLTVPWSARVHFGPHDYRRYTEHELTLLFRKFASAKIASRGTDITAICSKVIVIFIRCGRGSARLSLLSILGFLILAPMVPVALILGRLSLRGLIGSSDDPLGYTVIAIK